MTCVSVARVSRACVPTASVPAPARIDGAEVERLHALLSSEFRSPSLNGMANQIAAGPELLEYVREFSLREDEILRGLRSLTAGLPGGEALQVSPEEGQFLAFLVAATGVTDVLEIGTFTGYSTLCMARALPASGRLITCDITSRWPEIGAEHWRRAGVADRIDVRIGDASDTLEKLLADGFADRFGLVFLDADKIGYPRYYELALKLLRPGGVLVVDNTLFFGRVVDPLATDPDTEGVRALNALVRDDERVDVSMLPVADGLTLVRRR
ncbi:O-methyltransferase [Streptomyces sp. SolWspMP-5a-2]|nr:O-methyltransferase [Streptomyces sp. SolWspMP-5a-2]